MRSTCVILALLIAIATPLTMSAQDTGPRAGSWGAEASPAGDATLLRFRSNSAAWLIGFSGFYFKRDEGDDVGALEAETMSITTRLGWRGYRNLDSRLRPFTTLAALLGYNNSDLGPDWTVGGQFEYGGAYFFTRNVSLGASFDLRATYGRGTREQVVGGETTVTVFTVGTGLRFLGAVYF
jgi:hypothetical protein